MAEDHGNPPAERTEFDSKDEEIEYLARKVTYWFWRSDLSLARHYAEPLAVLIDNPNLTDPWRYAEQWVAVWEARENIEEAIRYADATINKYKADFASYDDEDRKCDFFRDDVKALEDALYLQADRYIRLGDRKGAWQRMTEASELARQHGVFLDNDQEELLKALSSENKEGKENTRKSRS